MAVNEGNVRVAAVAGGRRIEDRDGGQTPVGEIEERERRGRAEERERGGVGSESITQNEKKNCFLFFLTIGYECFNSNHKISN